MSGDVDEFFRQERIEFVLQLFAAYRLGKITVEAFTGIKCSVLFIGICSKDYDTCIPASSACLFLDLAAALDTVHLRHEMIHEDDVVSDVESLTERFCAACNGIYSYLGIAEKLGYDHEVSFVIVDNKDPCFRRFELRDVIRLLALSGLSEIVFADSAFTLDSLRDLDDERGTLGVNAVYRDLTAHEIDELLNDGKAQAGTFYVLRDLLIDTLKR